MKSGNHFSGETFKAGVCVVGSSNIDLVVKSHRLPLPGETILGGDFVMVPGGKGANQAVAAAKLGAKVYLVAKLGDDVFGAQSYENFKRTGVDTRFVSRTNKAMSGVASIIVDKSGNNSIVVASGANQMLTPRDVKKAQRAICGCGAVVSQLEIPMKTVECAARLAKKYRVPFILDPAPARKLSDKLLKMTDVIKPNETEAKILTGVDVKDERSARRAAEVLFSRGVKTVILTMGSKGFFVFSRRLNRFFAAKKVKAVDSTAAGDAFIGGFAFCIAQRRPLIEAVLFARSVASLSVTRMGAQPSMPTMKEVNEFIKTGETK
jgi:ribokinase